jgi:hypothetical protein
MTTDIHTPAAAPPIENRKSKIENPRSLLAQIKEDYIAHGRDWTRPGFRAMAVYRFGVWRMTIRSKILRAPFSILYRRWFRKVRNRYGIELPYSAILGRRVIIEHQSCIVIHGSSITPRSAPTPWCLPMSLRMRSRWAFPRASSSVRLPSRVNREWRHDTDRYRDHWTQ